MRLPMARLSVVFVALAVLAHWGLTCVQRLPYPYEAFSALEVPTDSPYLTEPPSKMIYSTRFQRNERLQAAQRLFEGKIQGSESVAVSPSGELIMLDKFGYIGPGRPLGYHVIEDGAALLVCDSLKGLLRVDLATGGIEVLSNRVTGGEPLHYVNDVDVAKDGTVYFSSSTEGSVGLHASGFYDTMRSFTLNWLRGDASGRLLSYDPHTRVTRELMRGLFFANGVAVSPDQTFVAVVETSTYRVHRYFLSGPKAGTSEVFVDGLPAFPDGMSTSSDGHFWVTQVAAPKALLHLIAPYRWMRQLAAPLLVTRPYLMCAPLGGVLKVSTGGAIVDALWDPEGQAVFSTSAVTEHGGLLYLGNLFGNFVSVLKL